jgi:hypothetical protein
LTEIFLSNQQIFYFPRKKFLLFCAKNLGLLLGGFM